MSARMEIVKTTFDDFIERNSVDALMASVTDDVTLKNAIPEGAPFGGEFRGKRGILDYFAKVETGLHSTRVIDYFESEDKIVVLGEEVQQIKSTGEEFPSEWGTVFTFRGNRIAGIRVIEDHSRLYVTLANPK